ncbi:MAG: hypothetical protein ACOCX5_00695, partial [Chloroflexota bacterium]
MARNRIQQAPAPTLPPVLENLVQGWRRFFVPGDISTLIIVTALLLIPPFSLSTAEWPVSMAVIAPVTVLSAVMGLIFARSQFGELMALLISSTYGVCLVLLFTAISLGGGLGAGVYAVFERTIIWLNDAT